MTRNGRIALIAGIFLLLLGFSLPSLVFVSLGTLSLLTLLIAIVCVRMSSRSMRWSVQVAETRLDRGAKTTLTIQGYAKHALFPLAPAEISLALEDDVQKLLVMPLQRKATNRTLDLTFRHVGTYTVGIHAVRIQDLLGLYVRQISPAHTLTEVFVLPQHFDLQPLVFSPGESGLGTMASATEDTSSPSDVRAYQSGDPLKKVHWKLSGRKQELLVRRFDEPTLPEALMLMNLSGTEQSGKRDLDLQDALTETAASCMLQAQKSGYQLSFPLYGTAPQLLNASMPMEITKEYLARTCFTEKSAFQDILRLESRRMRRLGATVIVTCELNGPMVDEMIHLRRMGPSLRLYLITKEPDQANLTPLISKLQDQRCEVLYVTLQDPLPS